MIMHPCLFYRPLMVTAIMGQVTAARDGLLEKVPLADGVPPPPSAAEGGPSGGGADSDLTAGVDINAQDDRGFTALHYAVDSGHTAFVEMLLSRGADAAIKGAPSPAHPDGVTAASLATTPAMRKLVQSIQGTGAPSPAAADHDESAEHK